MTVNTMVKVHACVYLGHTQIALQRDLVTQGAALALYVRTFIKRCMTIPSEVTG